MREFLRKLTSRKLWMAVAGIATGIAMAFGVEEGAISTVSGAVTALVCVVSYVLAEGKVDAARASIAAQSVQTAVRQVAQEGEAIELEPGD